MAILSQLLSPADFLSLNEEQLDTLYSYVEAEAMKHPEFMKQISAKFQKEVIPAMTTLRSSK